MGSAAGGRTFDSITGRSTGRVPVQSYLSIAWIGDQTRRWGRRTRQSAGRGGIGISRITAAIESAHTIPVSSGRRSTGIREAHHVGTYSGDFVEIDSVGRT